jgi:uncharacterized protein
MTIERKGTQSRRFEEEPGREGKRPTSDSLRSPCGDTIPSNVLFGQVSVNHRLRTMPLMNRKGVLGALVALSSLVFTTGALVPASRASAVSPNVVISQIYGGGGNTGATYKNDFIELYNKSSAAVNLSGWSVQYASSTGTSWQATPLSGTLAAGAYYLIQEAAGTGGTVNLPTPDAFGTIAMSGTTAKIALRNTTTLCSGTCSALPNTIDFVGYGTANDFEGSVGPATTNTTSILRAGTPRGAQDTDNNATDFSTGAPSPLGSGGSTGGGVTLIHDIQGTGFVSPKNGQTLTIEGIVTGVDDKIGYDNSPCTAYPRDAGLFVQEEDADADTDATTSEGIFVGNVSPRSSYPVGTKVRLTGLVKDGGGSLPPFDQTRMEVSSAPTILASSQPLPTAVTINAAATVAQTGAREYYETLEGMRVTLATGVANSGGTNKFNELFLEPGTVLDTLQRTDLASRLNSRIGLVDDAGAGNPTNPLLDYSSTSRVLADKGDTITNATGPLDYGFSNYKIMVQPGDMPTVTKTGVAYPYNRLAAKMTNQVRIASFNVENLFPTGGSLDCTTITATQYNDKRADVVDAIGRLLQAPEIVAVQELGDLRNATPSSLAVLQDVATDLGTGGYGAFSAHAVEGNDNRGIDVGFLVKNTVTVNSVTQYGKTEANPTASTCADVAGLLFDRPPLVLDATLPGTGGNVLVVTSHFSSKAAPDACRVAQATYVRNLVKGFETAQPSRKVIVTGDLNAFEDEGALTTLGDPTQTTLTNLWPTTPEPERYSYQFSGLLQTLDHMLVNGPTQPLVAGFQYVHFDNDYYQRTGVADGHKVSDHDPPVLTLSAATVPEPSGFDGIPQLIVGGGSDTTYLAMQRLENLYNATPGCALNTTSTSADKGKCLAGSTDGLKGNYDHDVAVGATPVGSSGGLAALLSSGSQYNPAIDYARASRGPNAGAETQQLNFWGYARDAIVVTSFGNRIGVSLTKQDLKDIYSCTKTNWSQFGSAPGTINPWDMQSSSGTYSVFKAYLDNITFGSCVRKLSTAIAPFENDVKPLLGDPGTTAANVNDMLWFMSFGNWQTYPATKQGTVAGSPVSTNIVAVDGTTPSNATVTNNSYAIVRTLYHVTKAADVAPGVGPDVTGADNGKAGAVRELTRWLCKTSNAQHETNLVTGRGMRTEIVLVINAEGFQQTPAGLRTPGFACAVTVAVP